MSAARRDERALREVAELRGLKARAAEQEAARAEEKRRAAAARHEEARSSLGAAEKGWAASMSGGRFDPSQALHWRHEVRVREGEEEARRGEAADAGGEAEAARRAAAGARGRAEAAGGVAGSALRAGTRRKDEALLAAAEDRLAHRRRS